MKKPKVSILLPVYNAEKYLKECLDSLLIQSFVDFEVIALNDASTDASLEILLEYKKYDDRIKIYNNELNLKLPSNLNKGIIISNSPLIARMDADDVCLPGRLQAQYDFMQRNQNVVVCGSWTEVYETGAVWRWPVSNDAIRTAMLFNCPLAHPTVMFRKNAIISINGYSKLFVNAEDYDLWERLAHNSHAFFANIPDVFVRYRLHPSVDRGSYKLRQRYVANAVRLRQLHRLGLSPNSADLEAHLLLARVNMLKGIREVKICNSWAKRLENANKIFEFYNSKEMEYYIRRSMLGAFSELVYRRYVPDVIKYVRKKSKNLFAFK